MVYNTLIIKVLPAFIALTLPAHQVSVAVAYGCIRNGGLEDRLRRQWDKSSIKKFE